MSQTIFITGASSGIGKATAKFFHEKGWNVVATMRTPEKETELTTLDRVLVTRLDVLDSDSIASAIAQGIEKFGKIDVLVNNAGYAVLGLLEAIPIEKIRRQFDVNVLGLLAVTKAILPHFRENRSGVLINVSSMGGKITYPLISLYHGTKFAVEGITESLSYELQAIGCKAKIIEPGAIKTDFANRSLDFNNDESLSEYQELAGSFFSAMEKNNRFSSEPIVVAEVIYQAATDGTDTIRYPAGEDAKAIIAQRKAADDKTFMQGMKQQFGIQ